LINKKKGSINKLLNNKQLRKEIVGNIVIFVLLIPALLTIFMFCFLIACRNKKIIFEKEVLIRGKKHTFKININGQEFMYCNGLLHREDGKAAVVIRNLNRDGLIYNKYYYKGERYCLPKDPMPINYFNLDGSLPIENIEWINLMKKRILKKKLNKF
jgi:hypothetical protein